MPHSFPATDYSRNEAVWLALYTFNATHIKLKYEIKTIHYWLFSSTLWWLTL